MARLASTVYVLDPDTHQWVICDAGTEPEPHLAALIRTPSAWEDGEVPEAALDSARSTAAGDREPAGAETEEPDKKPRTRRPAAKADE
ncbi:hypothetical protein ACFC0S_16450 [Streptomyces sp. NPDC056084]|uniref:hypothetical protein n=1 Tax=unclassified Streptomyces TaxID=2593676 RepID=UPI0035DB0B3D